MKLKQLSVYKIMLAVLVVLLFLLIYYHNLFTSFGQQVNNNTESIQFVPRRSENDTSANSKRIKRFLIFQGGGVVKLVLGTSFPIIMADSKRSLNYFYNFQMQYDPPPIPLYWWSLYNTTTFAARTNLGKRSVDTSIQTRVDKSRTLIYEFIETILERSRKPDNNCLLKIICELAHAPLTEDYIGSIEDTRQQNEIFDDYGRNIYHKLINTIFTPPSSPNIDERYINARLAGQNGANCDKTFGKCPVIESWFQRFTKFI